jgi:SAM-dependent methyltransferase
VPTAVTPEPAPAPPRPTRSLAEALAREPELRILDTRAAEAFSLGHPAGAGRLGAADFALRRMELPSRATPILVVHDDPAAARAAAEALVVTGYERVQWLERPLADEPAGLAGRAPAARLWSASSFLERVIDRCPQGRALDLASGSGRSAVYLALSGRQVEAWDVDARALAMASDFASRHGVRIRTRECDLEAGPLPLPEPRFDLVVVVRYLHRELFPWLEQALAPGGSLVYETFRVGQEKFGHPRRARHLLQPGELARAFPSLVVDEYEETPADHPPVLAHLLAHRPR